jgi:hypothetical protein
MKDIPSVVKDLINVLEHHASDNPDEYVNPHFLLGMHDLLEEHYDIDNDEIYEYVQSMVSF